MSDTSTERHDRQLTTQPLSAAAQLRGLWECLRPYQWPKNLLVFGGLIFSGRLADPWSCLLSILAFIAFCALSSAGYILNDLLDVSSDRHHPRKKDRPLAAGRVSPALATGLMAGLAAAAILGAAALSRHFLETAVGYAVLSVAYTVYLKRLMIVDVLALSFGFVLRAVAGAAVLKVAPSSWLVICTMMLALLVAFGKRRAEVILLGDGSSRHRSTLEGYTVEFLDTMTLFSSVAAFLSYVVYTVATDTGAVHGTSSLVWTTPFVFYGIARYLYLMQTGDQAGDPTRLLLHDRPSLINLGLWAATACCLIYLLPG